jgi:hypothetical protein
MIWLKIILGAIGIVYAIGFCGTLALHLALPMVEPPLALARAVVWPRWLYDGWPHGTPRPMD